MNDEDSDCVLLTGVAGFIGSRVARQLLQQGMRVVGIDNLNDYYDPQLKRARLAEIRHPLLEFQETDIEDRAAVARLFKSRRFAAIVNLAARAGVRASIDNPLVYYTTNVVGNLNLLELTRRHEVPKYVLASTSSLYAGQPMPFTETLPVNEPISPYAASKKAAEVTCYTYHHLFGIDVSVLRFFTVYGPAGRPDMAIFKFICGLQAGQPIPVHGDGEQTRDFTFVEDIARGVLASLQPVGFEVINLGGGKQPTTVAQLIAHLEQLLGKTACIDRLPDHIADVRDTSADIRKAKEVLGWQPRTDLLDGLAETVRWHQQHRELALRVAGYL